MFTCTRINNHPLETALVPQCAPGTVFATKFYSILRMCKQEIITTINSRSHRVPLNWVIKQSDSCSVRPNVGGPSLGGSGKSDPPKFKRTPCLMSDLFDFMRDSNTHHGPTTKPTGSDRSMHVIFNELTLRATGTR